MMSITVNELNLSEKEINMEHIIIKPVIPEEELIVLLPSGSGIDSEWEITEHKNGNVTARNSFHSMDGNGSYDGYMPFTVRIYRVKKTRLHKLKGSFAGKWQVICMKGDLDFRLSCYDERRKSFVGLGDYLVDTIQQHLDERLTPDRVYESITDKKAQVLFTQGAIDDD